jgi:hypothetical protein
MHPQMLLACRDHQGKTLSFRQFGIAPLAAALPCATMRLQVKSAEDARRRAGRLLLAAAA